MEHLDIGEKRYIKVSSAARETGYTTDYIGQLCRAKKIDAKLVGRTWYVAYNELLAHRQTRGRSSHEKAKKAFKKQVAAVEGETRIPISIEHGGVRKRLVSEHITYHTDEAELMPTPVSVTVSEKPEHKIKVEKDSAEHQVDFNTAEKPEIKWNGTIVIKSLNDALDDEITSNDKPEITPLTRHMAIHNPERSTAVSISASTAPADPLLQKERFLTRVNRAHDLNTLQAALHQTSTPEIQSPITAITTSEKTSPTRAKYTFGTWAYTLSWTGLLLLTFIAISSFFLEQRTLYIADTNANNAAPFYQQGIALGTSPEVRNNALYTISVIRDMFKNKH